MKFLVDAHLPRRLATRLRESGHDAIHTLDLPEGNRTGDAEILRIAAKESRVVVTKDADFVDSHLVKGQPRKLLLIATGNIRNRDLQALLLPQLAMIEAAFQRSNYVELTRSEVIGHG